MGLGSYGRMTKFDKSYALELLMIAEQDLASSKVLASHLQTGRIENVFFLAQQAVEKSLKAYLCHVHGEFPLVHDIGILLGKMDELPPRGYDLVTFSQFAGIRRYETGKAQLDKEDVDAAIETATEVTAWVRTRIESKAT